MTWGNIKRSVLKIIAKQINEGANSEMFLMFYSPQFFSSKENLSEFSKEFNISFEESKDLD